MRKFSKYSSTTKYVTNCILIDDDTCLQMCGYEVSEGLVIAGKKLYFVDRLICLIYNLNFVLGRNVFG